MGGFGRGAAAVGGAVVGVADGAGQPSGDLAGVAQAGAKLVGESEQGAPVLGGIEFVAGEAVLGTDARRRRGGIDGRGVAAAGAFVQGASGPGAEEALKGELGDVGDVADGVQSVLGEGGRAFVPTPGSSRTGRGRRKAVIASGESSMTVRRPGPVSAQAIAASIRFGAAAAELRRPK
ncbi:hypothetical protein OV320_1279 [Actinobacteria bacterium OV320]|nr:hypothetical protein OV320_1279 [Actinobacteria bacterium OV320]